MSAQAFPLSALRALSVSGEDARAFLQNQLSSDLGAVSTARGQLSAWHDPKGRVLAFLRVLPAPQGFFLVMHASVLEPVQRRLGMFVLRAKVTIETGPPVHGMRADGFAALAAGGGLQAGEEPFSAVCSEGFSAMRMPGKSGWLVVGAPGAAGRNEAAATAWDYAEIEAGLPEVYAETSGQFVSQMLNLDHIGAVSFTKGCFPGQEIVARTHYLGRIKRRMRLFHAPGDPPAAGDALADSAGTVVRAARGEADCAVLAIVPEDAPGPFALADGRTLA